ncbi:hypothetical protein ABZ154_30205 [Streptomyces sp. NPDC006261]|uniref:hypothetical protein n=1 Tax=Streptomyces sp. NPDC006261 TaxID=3156739 RepID=UPI0033BBED90
MSTSTLTTNVRLLRGPSRVLLRLHRRILWGAGAVTVAAIVGMIAAALRADQIVADFASTGCTLSSTAESCFQPARNFTDQMFDLHRMLMHAGLTLTALPAFVGAFVAGPMIAREWETGSIKLSWTQSTPPSAWLAARLATLAVPVVCGIVVLSAVFSWSRSRLERPFPAVWEDVSAFGATGTVPIASALLALGLGTLTGLLLRRTVPALAVALLGSALVTFVLGLVRDHLWPVVKSTYPLQGAYPVPRWAYVVEHGFVNAEGDRLPIDICVDSLDYEGCLAGHDGLQNYVHYHPASHYWPLQLVETGILLALAALATLAAFRVLRRLHG